MRVAKDMVGIFFGCLKVIRESDKSDPKNKKFYVECIYCGKIRTALGGNIRRCATSKSGGCDCQETARHNRKSSKDDWKHRFYGVWDGMMRRCYVPEHTAFSRYGGRGIAVCDEWHVARNFFAWAESQNTLDGWQLDRERNNESYSPENCRFVPPVVNANNKSNNRRITVAGNMYSIAEASRAFGVGKTTIKERLNRGWSDVESVRKV